MPQKRIKLHVKRFSYCDSIYLCPVRKIISILLLAVYLFGATDLHQLVKIPRLVEHYQQFVKDNPGFGFSTFMRVHYSYQLNIDDSDYEQDRQLPFKSLDGCCISMATNIIVPQPYYFVAPRIFLPSRDYPLHKEDFHAYIVSQSIFQPPKA